MADPAPVLRAADLVVTFAGRKGPVRALNGVNLGLNRGVTFGLVGESGCGKSVFARALLRLIQRPGRIADRTIGFRPSADGAERNLLHAPERAMEALRGDRLAMVFQEPSAALNPLLRVGDQVAEPFLIHRRAELARVAAERVPRLFRPLCRLAAARPESFLLGLLDRLPLLRRWETPLRTEARRRAVQVIDRLGIPDAEAAARRFPHELSGGMKQRIAIAAALALRPLVLVADEATSNLDVTVQARILDLLRDLRRTEVATVLLITHDLGVVAETCERAAVLYAGTVCEVADVEDLFAHPRHPYTRALLDAVPPDAPDRMPEAIPGTVPDLANPPPGCPFAPRCPNAEAPCSQRVPPLLPVDDRETTSLGENSGEHLAACFFLVEP